MRLVWWAVVWDSAWGRGWLAAEMDQLGTKGLGWWKAVGKQLGTKSLEGGSCGAAARKKGTGAGRRKSQGLIGAGSVGSEST